MTERSGMSPMPGIGVSIFIGAVGAIMRYAVTTSTPGFSIHTAGVILMIVGGVGALLSLVLWSSVSPFGGRRTSVSRRQVTSTEDGHERGSTVVNETKSSG